MNYRPLKTFRVDQVSDVPEEIRSIRSIDEIIEKAGIPKAKIGENIQDVALGFSDYEPQSETLKDRHESVKAYLVVHSKQLVDDDTSVTDLEAMDTRRILGARESLHRLLPGIELIGVIKMDRRTLSAWMELDRGVRTEQGNESTSSGVQTEAEQLFDDIVRDALKRGASDIHILIRKHVCNIKMRIHGLRHEIRQLTPEDGQAVVRTAYNTLSESDSRAGSLNEATFQDAVIERFYPDAHIRLRFSSSPIEGGQKIVMRLLNLSKAAKSVDFETLGYAETHMEILNTVFSKPQGAVIIAGTTSSGKSTTLKTGIETLYNQRPFLAIHTIENPAEYVIPCAEQVSISRDKRGGMKDSPFVEAIRSAMRQDPDVIMIGEVRDAETAHLMQHATQSGHQVLTTVHASSALEIVDRLAAMGIDYHTLSQLNFISGLIYQKLVPVLCPDCKVPIDPEKTDPALLKRILRVADLETDTIFFEGSGCPTCQGGVPGVVGRTVCSETVMPTPDMLKCFAKSDVVGAWKIWRKSMDFENKHNFYGRTSLDHGISKMCLGVVSPNHIEAAFGAMDAQVDVVEMLKKEIAAEEAQSASMTGEQPKPKVVKSA